MTDIHVIGAGLAGSEAAWQLANAGINVILHEMRPLHKTDAHKTGDCAELVCSNSFRSDDHTRNAVGLLHQEMRLCNSLIMAMGDLHKVPAGGALAVDREAFAAAVTEKLKAHPHITFAYEEIAALPSADMGHVIVATGPLTSKSLSESILKHTGEEYLSFFDAIAPIVHFDSIDMDKAWFQSRYDKGEGADYINCPMNKEQYYAFIDALNTGEKTDFKEWEKTTPYFEGCLPIEVMAERGKETLAFGPMKPVGLTNPHAQRSNSVAIAQNISEKPYAVVQLRQDNKLGTLYNMVGFQTKLKYGAQEKIFRTIPGLENAEFARLGGLHRNTFINSPKLLDGFLRLKTAPHIRFAGQITGCEGYVESASVGLMAGRFLADEIAGRDISTPPATTAMGALLSHITGGADAKTFQPMNVNFGLFPPMKIGKDKRAAAMCERALRDIANWLELKQKAA
jgi:methylenetetrahydrofolate--tRNA-(uracil-5-)-methyltransferase